MKRKKQQRPPSKKKKFWRPKKKWHYKRGWRTPYKKNRRWNRFDSRAAYHQVKRRIRIQQERGKTPRVPKKRPHYFVYLARRDVRHSFRRIYKNSRSSVIGLKQDNYSSKFCKIALAGFSRVCRRFFQVDKKPLGVVAKSRYSKQYLLKFLTGVRTRRKNICFFLRFIFRLNSPANPGFMRPPLSNFLFSFFWNRPVFLKRIAFVHRMLPTRILRCVKYRLITVSREIIKKNFILQQVAQVLLQWRRSQQRKKILFLLRKASIYGKTLRYKRKYRVLLLKLANKKPKRYRIKKVFKKRRKFRRWFKLWKRFEWKKSVVDFAAVAPPSLRFIKKWKFWTLRYYRTRKRRMWLRRKRLFFYSRRRKRKTRYKLRKKWAYFNLTSFVGVKAKQKFNKVVLKRARSNNFFLSTHWSSRWALSNILFAAQDKNGFTGYDPLDEDDTFAPPSAVLEDTAEAARRQEWKKTTDTILLPQLFLQQSTDFSSLVFQLYFLESIVCQKTAFSQTPRMYSALLGVYGRLITQFYARFLQKRLEKKTPGHSALKRIRQYFLLTGRRKVAYINRYRRLRKCFKGRLHFVSRFLKLRKKTNIRDRQKMRKVKVLFDRLFFWLYRHSSIRTFFKQHNAKKSFLASRGRVQFLYKKNYKFIGL